MQQNTLQNLSNGQAKGITVNRNLTVYTSLPTEREELNNAQNILETLVRNHSLVLIDCILIHHLVTFQMHKKYI